MKGEDKGDVDALGALWGDCFGEGALTQDSMHDLDQTKLEDENPELEEEIPEASTRRSLSRCTAGASWRARTRRPSSCCRR